MFYLLFCFARMNWAGPFDLGIYGALNNWFVARRAIATSIATVGADGRAGGAAADRAGRDAAHGGWRAGWLAVGATVLVVGFVPVWLLLVRRPEDVGLLPDRRGSAPTRAPLGEPRFTRARRCARRAFWLLSLYTVLVYPVQAGVSLHQAPYLIERGLAPAAAARWSACSR